MARYPLTDFFKVLELLLDTASDAFDASGERYDDEPSLANILVWKYEEKGFFLELDGEIFVWRVKDTTATEDEACLVIEIPILTDRMYALLVGDGRPIAQVVNVGDLRVQIRDLLKAAHHRKYGSPV
jgi:hypothetical protein